MPTIPFLFDIDGTLIDGAGAGRRAMEAAFVDVLAAEREAIARVKFAGSTDPAIVRSGLRAAGLAEDDASIERVLRRYVELLPQEIAAVADDYRVHDGVEAALAEASRIDGAAVGLGTGNVAAGPGSSWSRSRSGSGSGSAGSAATRRRGMRSSRRARGAGRRRSGRRWRTAGYS